MIILHGRRASKAAPSMEGVEPTDGLFELERIGGIYAGRGLIHGNAPGSQAT